MRVDKEQKTNIKVADMRRKEMVYKKKKLSEKWLYQ